MESQRRGETRVKRTGVRCSLDSSNLPTADIMDMEKWMWITQRWHRQSHLRSVSYPLIRLVGLASIVMEAVTFEVGGEMPIGAIISEGATLLRDRPALRLDSRLICKYEVLSVIGKGSFSQVLRVRVNCPTSNDKFPPRTTPI